MLLFSFYRDMFCSSCSPDFGVGGVSDRLGQISPKLVFFSLGYLYGGRWHDCRGLAKEVLAQLPGARTFSIVLCMCLRATLEVGGTTSLFDFRYKHVSLFSSRKMLCAIGLIAVGLEDATHQGTSRGKPASNLTYKLV